MLLNVILVGVITGIIIDTFTEIREESDKIEDKIEVVRVDKIEDKTGLCVSWLRRVCQWGLLGVFLVILSMFVWSVVYHLEIKKS